jgi:predicted MFS family arabinose efflux permease
MFAYYATGALGSVLGPVLFARAGWQPVCVVSAAIAAGGLLLTLLAHYAERDVATSRA